jgi:hypothetical protein
MLHAVSLLLLYASFAVVAAVTGPEQKGLTPWSFGGAVKAPGWGCSIHKVSLCATIDHLLAKRVMMMNLHTSLHLYRAGSSCPAIATMDGKWQLQNHLWPSRYRIDDKQSQLSALMG